MMTTNPFLTSAMHRSVSVAREDGPYASTLAALKRIDLSPAHSKRVLLKPNMGRVAPPEAGVTTHPDVIAAAVDAFTEAGADVAIGESPIVGVDVQEAFDIAGVTALAGERNCPLIDMDRRPFIEMSIPDGQVIHSLRVCPEVQEFDFVVSIPVMKMHMHTGVTLSVKNMKGCLWRRSKVKLHMLGPLEGSDLKTLDIAIADMSSVLRPHFSIIDGAVGMEGLGPSAGRAKRLGVVVAGADALAADAVACTLMGTRAESVPHLSIAAQRGYGVIDLDHVTVAPDNWQDWVSPFAPPPENLAIEFPNITVLDNNSCSACQSTLLLFLKRYRERLFDYFPSHDNINIAIGEGHTDLPEGTLCIGNCTAQHRRKGIFVPGCPPVASEILKAVTGKPSIDTANGRSSQPGNTDD